MKKILLTIAIGLSSVAIIAITASAFIVGEISSVVCLSGIMTGLSGLFVGGIVGSIEYYESKNKKTQKEENQEEYPSEPYIPQNVNEKIEIEITKQENIVRTSDSQLSK